MNTQYIPLPGAQVEKGTSSVEQNTKLEARARKVFGQFKKAGALAPKVPREVGTALKPSHKESKRLKQRSEHPQVRLKGGLSQIHGNAFC